MAGGRPIETVITTNVDGVIKGAQKVADSFEEIQDDLKDTSKAGDKAFEQLEDSGKEAAGVLDRDLTTALEEVEAKAQSTGKGIGHSVKSGTDKAGEGFEELKGEANSTAKEAAASFDGSAEGIADTFQELAANVFAGFGPAGAVAGLAAAVGIGIAITKMQELADTNDEAKTKMAELGREIYDAGGQLDDAAIADKIKDIAFALKNEDNPWTPWANEAKTGIGVVKEALDGVGEVAARDVFRGLAGDIEAGQHAYDDLTASIEKDTKALEDHLIGYGDLGPVYDAEGEKLQASITKRGELKKSLEESSGASEGAREEVEYYTDAMGQSADAVQDRIDKENELADINKGAVENEIEYNQQLAETSKGIAERGKATDRLSEAGQANNLTLIDLAETGSSYLQGLYDQGAGADVLASKVTATRDAFVAQAIAAGYSKTEAEKLASSYGLIPPEVSTKVSQTGAAETKAAVDAVPNEKSTEVNVTATGTAETQGAINNVEGKDVAVDVQDFNTARQTQDRINALKGRDVKVDVQDFNTVRQTQDRINALKGRDVFINVRIGNEADFQREISRLTATASKTINVYSRETKDPMTP